MKRTEEHYNEYITIIIEKATGRADVTLKEPDGNVYYYAEKHGSKWELKFCENGFCYNATLVDTCKTLKECIAIIHDVCEDLTEHYKSVEEAEAEYRTYKGYTITGPLTELDVKTSVMKSLFNRYYGKQVIDAEMCMVKTELTGLHVSGLITETGTMMLSCDIYAQDLDIEESYLAYKVENAYVVYDEISLTRTSIYADSDAVKQFFVSRVKALEAETIKTLY